jgi:hypothetical protein
MSEAKLTTDHEEIRRWAESRDGRPATVKATMSGGEPGILRIDFDPPDESLEPISWEKFFDKFDREKLAFLYQDRTADGKISRFHKFVDHSEMRQSHGDKHRAAG